MVQFIGTIIQDSSLHPRDALAESVKRAKEIYKKDGVYSKEMRESFKEVINQNKEKFPHLYKKGD